MNMKEQPELLTQEDYNDLCMEMLAFQQVNNRLSYDDGPSSEAGNATVEDKSFSFVEPASEAEIHAPVPLPAAASLLDGVKNLFRS
jgi:hypothetical protein